MDKKKIPQAWPKEWNGLAEKAMEVRTKAYAPYSGFLVGAALESADGKVFAGCNVENASFPAGVCAERNALGQLVGAGGKPPIQRIVVVADAEGPVFCCGICLQALSEFGRDAQVLAINLRDESTQTYVISELLPKFFSGKALRKK